MVISAERRVTRGSISLKTVAHRFAHERGRPRIPFVVSRRSHAQAETEARLCGTLRHIRAACGSVRVVMSVEAPTVS